MESAVALNNALLDAQAKMPAGSFKLDLPMFVVVGAQSSGKSSVLDNVIGRSFLPRGSGTVTRRPLVLMMQCSRGVEYAEFNHLPGQRFTTDAQICAAIDRATEDECGAKGFSSRPIHLHFYSPNVPDLTLVDLPGLIKAHAADMDPSAPQTIRSMVMEFATRANSILLAVTPATGDLVTSDAIQLAREVDPEGQRTLGVLTKLDLMDDGTDCAAALLGDDPRAPKLRLGYVGVVNRGQKDINNGVDLTAARARERAFFAEHDVYGQPATMGAARLGTEALVSTSSALLVEHIERSLPTLKSQITQQLATAEKELDKFTGLADPATIESTLHTGVANARNAFSAQLNPGAGMAMSQLRARAFSAGHDIESLFVGLMSELKAESLEYSFGAHDHMARKMAGVGGMIFDVDQSFRFLVREHIPKFEEVCLRLIERVNERLEGAVGEMELPSEAAFPLLAKEVRATCLRMLAENAAPTRALVRDLVAMESSRVNLSHPQFVARPSELERFNARMVKLAKQKGPVLGINHKIDDVVHEGDALKRRLKAGRMFSMGHTRHLILLRTGHLQWHEHGGIEARGSLHLLGCKLKRGPPSSSSAEPPPRAELDRSASDGAVESTSLARKPAKKASERKQVCIYGGVELGANSHNAILLELENESEADEWEKKLRRVIERLDTQPADVEAVSSPAVGVAEPTDSPASMADRQLTDAARVNHFKLVHMLQSYVSIVQSTLCDLVPKAITSRLLNATRDAINARLEPTLGRGSTAKVVEELMAPSPAQAARLARLQAEVTSLRECARVVAHVRAPGLPPIEAVEPRSPLSELRSKSNDTRPSSEAKAAAASAVGVSAHRSVRASALEGREQPFTSQPL